MHEWAVTIVLSILHHRLALCYTPPSIVSTHQHSRRDALLRTAAITFATVSPPLVVSAEEQPIGDVQLLNEATEVLDSLLDNWNKATIDCNYADVPRELLETKNKEQLLEKASGE